MACVNGRDRRTTNMSKHQPFHAVQLCHARDLDRASVASHAASEANGAVPACSLSKHEVGRVCPPWEFEKLRRPGDLFSFGLDDISIGPVRSMNHVVRFY
jgi:hypothetical protein